MTVTDPDGRRTTSSRRRCASSPNAGRRTLKAALVEARRTAAARAAEVAVARARIVAGSDDVSGLERFSVRRLRAAVRGVTHDQLARERTEVVRAEAVYALAADRHEAAVARVEEISASLTRSRGARRRLEQVRAEIARTVLEQGGTDGARLEEILTEEAVLRAEGVEIVDAVSAASTAANLLERAGSALEEAAELASPRAVLTTDPSSHDATVAAATELRRVTVALARLDAELADVRLAGIARAGLDAGLADVDVWVDAFVVPLGVRHEIEDARSRASRVLAAVRRVEATLAGRARDVEAGLRALDDERARILSRG